MSRGNLATVLLALCLATRVSLGSRIRENFEDGDFLESNYRSQSRIDSVARDTGDKTLSEELAEKIALLTPYGRIVVNLDKRNAPEMVNLILKKAKSTHKACRGCQFHRAEARPGRHDPPEGPPYGLIQGSFSKLKKAGNIVKKEGTREVKSGDLVMIPGTYDFYIALADHPGWGAAHTVVGRVEDFVVADLIGVQPFTTYKHPTQGTLMRMMKDKVSFIVTDDIEQLVMPRTNFQNRVTIRSGANGVIAGLDTKESDNEDVFGEGDVDSREDDELVTNQGHDEFLDRNKESIDDELDQESLDEEADTDFIDEELEQRRKPEMKRGQRIAGLLKRNGGRNSDKNAQDAFDNLDGEEDLDGLANEKDDFEDEEDEFMEKDVAEQMLARNNRSTVQTRVGHKSTRSDSNTRSESHYMEEDFDYNNEDTENGDDADDGNERDGGALAYQHHNKAPERKKASQDFEEDFEDDEKTSMSRNQGKMNGERKGDSKGGEKSTSDGSKLEKRTGGDTKRDGLPF